MGELIRLFGSFTVFFLPPQTSLPPPLIGRSDGRLPPQSATNFSGFCWNRLCGISWSKEWWKYGQLLPPHPFFSKMTVTVLKFSHLLSWEFKHISNAYNYFSLAWIFSSIWFWWIIIHLFRKNQHSSKRKNTNLKTFKYWNKKLRKKIFSRISDKLQKLKLLPIGG